MTETSTEKQTPQGAALYVHWPFCKKKCPYCDFNSHVREAVNHTEWREALLAEMRYWHERAPEHRIRSIFFGGGTPSLMEPQTVGAIIMEAQQLWGLETKAEITLEANPTSVEAEKFHGFRAAGVNRVSLGVQSLRAESLAFLGREHSAAEAMDAIALAADIFPRYSFDLIYALPNQSVAAWEQELKEAIALARGHLSLYQLTIEENTAFYHAYHAAKAFALPKESLAADLYAATGALMEHAGMPAYEVSNYAAAGQESRHNLCYWRGEPYFGIGAGAHGRVDVLNACAAARLTPTQLSAGTRSPHPFASGSPWEATRVATRNLKSPERWLDAVQKNGHGCEEETALTLQERAEEKMLMGLRLCREGVHSAQFSVAEWDYLQTLWRDGRVEKLEALGMLECTGDTLRTTPQGQLVLNSLIEALLA